MVISSDRLIALAGVWEPSPISSLPALTAFSHVWMVPSGIPNSLAALAPPISLASLERVQFILANTIQHKDSDGRVSRDNKAWAKTIPMPEDSGTSRHCAYLVVDEVNLGLTDLFTRQARKTLQEPEKGSVLQKLKQEPTTHKPALSKKQEPER